jgi:hypothetical protein
MPPTACASLYTRLAHKQKQTFLHTLHHLITWCNKASLPFQVDFTQQTYQTDSTPFWKLLFIFESTILAPPPHTSKPQSISYSTLLKQRLTLFQSGSIKQLYTESRPQKDTPLPTIALPTFDDLSFNHAAQLAADQDNLQAAWARISSSAPNVTLNDHYLSILKKLLKSPMTRIEYL